MKKSQRARVANYLDRRPYWLLHFENGDYRQATGDLFRARAPEGYLVNIDIRKTVYSKQRDECRQTKADRRLNKDLRKWLKPLIGWVCVGVDRKLPMQIWKRRKPRSYK